MSLITSKYSGVLDTCLQVEDDVPGSTFLTETCDENVDFQLFDYNDETMELKSRSIIPQLCVTEDSTGQLITLEECTGDGNQQWLFDPYQDQIYNNETGNCISIDIEVESGNPNIITNPCQFVTPTGEDNWVSDAFVPGSDSSSSASSGSESSGSHSSSDGCNEGCQRNRIMLYLGISILIIFIITLGLAVAYAIYRNKNKNKSISNNTNQNQANQNQANQNQTIQSKPVYNQDSQKYYIYDKNNEININYNTGNPTVPKIPFGNQETSFY